jgi:polar amino acid transport system substrate-binding protein
MGEQGSFSKTELNACHQYCVTVPRLAPGICLIAILVIFFGTQVSAETLKLTMRADSEAGKLGTQILIEAYRRTGHEIEVIGFPGARAISEANRGNSDGEVVRLKRVLKDFPNLRVVPEPLLEVETSIASKNHQIKVTGWETVNNYSATTVRGYKSIEKRLQAQSANFTNSVDSALRMLQFDRVEILVLSKLDLRLGLKNFNYPDIKIIEPSISKVLLFHMLHKSRAALIPAVSKALTGMKADGTYQRILNTYTGS